jgi:hypothetical protein
MMFVDSKNQFAYYIFLSDDSTKGLLYLYCKNLLYNNNFYGWN